MVMRFVSLFSGIGGLDIGLERAGLECVAQIENDPWCQRILNKHWPEVPKYENVQDVRGSSLPAAELFAGGFPCQPVSLSGRRQGTSDPRWLWPEFSRLVGEVRPNIIFVENVPGIRSLGGAEVIADLATMGYNYQWGELSAATFGAPHLRKRFILVAYSPGSGLPRLWEERELGQGWSEAQTPWLDWWSSEPYVDRVDYGPADRVDRIRAIGNAVVPALAEWVGTRLIEFDRLS